MEQKITGSEFNLEGVKVDSSAHVDPSAQLYDGVTIARGAIVGPNVIIGQGTHIGPNAVIEGKTIIGKNNRVFPNVLLGLSHRISNTEGHLLK